MKDVTELLVWSDIVCTISLFGGFGLLWLIKSRSVAKQTGDDVYALAKGQTSFQRYFKSADTLLRISIVFIVIAQLFWGASHSLLSPWRALDTEWGNGLGVVLGLVGLAICRIAQVNMGNSWRVGVDYEAKLGLVKNGLFSVVRNPTYTGLFLLFAGVWCVNPTVMVSYWVLTWVLLITFQVRNEEDYLQTQYGEEYTEYYKTTKRFVPFL